MLASLRRIDGQERERIARELGAAVSSNARSGPLDVERLRHNIESKLKARWNRRTCAMSLARTKETKR